MSSIGEWIGETLFNAGKAVLDRAKAFGRRLSPEQQREQLEDWNRNHMPSLTTGTCIVCGVKDARDTEHCPGPYKRWSSKGRP